MCNLNRQTTQLIENRVQDYTEAYRILMYDNGRITRAKKVFETNSSRTIVKPFEKKIRSILQIIHKKNLWMYKKTKYKNMKL